MELQRSTASQRLFLLLLLLVGDGISTSHGWTSHFLPNELQLRMNSKAEVLLELRDVPKDAADEWDRYSFHLASDNPKVAYVEPNNATISLSNTNSDGTWRGKILLEAIFLGEAKVTVRLNDAMLNVSSAPANSDKLESFALLRVISPKRVIDDIFLYSIILFMSFFYINFGAALNVDVLRGLLGRPVGPCIAFVTQVLGMPLLSYALGVFIFPESPVMQLGLFFTGISPSGGASNTWAAVLGANINLSVLMTTISNVGAFATMYLWTITLGRLIFERANIKVPYRKIATYCVGMIVPLLIGLVIQRKLPRVAQVLVRLLKPISASLIIFIVIFAMITKFYIFKLFSWQIALAGFLLPVLGYCFAWLAARLLHQNTADALAISIETGIQNTGTAIFLLIATLPQPLADMTTVVPVAVATMTPLPLLGIYLYQRCSGAKAAETIAAEHQRIV